MIRYKGMKRINLVQMRIGGAGIVVEIQGGYGIRRRMYALGVRPGKRVVKVSSQLWRGPVTIKVDNFQVAIGFGIACRIIVEI